MDLNLFYFDKEVSKRRIDEIDKLRAAGGKTDLEIWWKNSMKKKSPAQEKGYGKRVFVSVTDTSTKEVKHYKSLNQACEDNGYNYCSVKNRLYKEPKRIFKNRNLELVRIFEKDLDEDLVVPDRKVKNIGNRKWTDKEMAFLVQAKRKHHMKWGDVADKLEKGQITCQSKYRRLNEEGKADYYLNLDIDLGGFE